MELKSSEKLAIKYHDIFDYPLTSKELYKWKSNKGITGITSIINKSGFYFIKNREEIIKKRLGNERCSRKKLILAKKTSRLLSKIPTVKFVGITGALAMNNASKNSDIDLMIITKSGTLWLTRLFVYLLIVLFGIKTRKPKDKQQRDKLCLNMWLDENDFVWNRIDRNMYTAHEVLQIVPLVNKDKTYEKFLSANTWVFSYWPNASKIIKSEKLKNSSAKERFLEYLAYKIQYWYMSKKITREVVTPTRAIFHPNDWGKIVLQRTKN